MALAEQVHRFGTVATGVMKPQVAQGFAKPPPGFFVNGELDEFHAVEAWWRGQDGVAGFAFHQPQGAQSVARHQSSRRGAEIVVEDFQRKWAAIAAGQHGLQERRDRQMPLAREVAKMPAPGQHIHRQLGRVGKLHEEQFVSGNGGDAGWVVAKRQSVEAVHDQAERGMIGGLRQCPRPGAIA